MKTCIKALLTFLITFSFIQINAQHVIDEVISVVGNEAILKSEVEFALTQFKDIPEEKSDETRCWVLDQLMTKKLLLSKAKTDSLKVSDDQVNSELDRRLEFFIQQIGSEKALEEYYGKSVVEIKNDFRESIKEQLLIDQMQAKITGEADVSPSEVKKFFNDIPKDSLPYYNTEVEVGQIVIYPQVGKQEKEEAKNKLKEIRQEIVKGAKFSTQAIIYSEDKGTAVQGGDLGMQSSSTYVPEFAAAALTLKKDSLSGIVESKYGFHLIQMIERKGDNIHVRHILIQPKISPIAQTNAKSKLDSIRSEILKDSLKFETAAYKFSMDDETKNRGGFLVDPKTTSSKIPVDQLDSKIFFTIDKLKPGEISQVEYFKTMDEKDGYRIFYLKSKTPPHKANLDQDYARIKQIANEYEKSKKMDKWLEKTIPHTYVHICDAFSKCEQMEKWKKGSAPELGKN